VLVLALRIAVDSEEGHAARRLSETADTDERPPSLERRCNKSQTNASSTIGVAEPTAKILATIHGTTSGPHRAFGL